MPGRGGTGRTRHRLEHSHLAALAAATSALQLARATPGRRPVGRATAPCPSRLASPQRTSHLLPQRSRIRWHRPRVRLAPWGLPSPGRCLPVRVCRSSQPARTPRRFRLESFRNSGAGVTNAAPRCSRLRPASSPDGISSQSVKLAPARFTPWSSTLRFTARRQRWGADGRPCRLEPCAPITHPSETPDVQGPRGSRHFRAGTPIAGWTGSMSMTEREPRACPPTRAPSNTKLGNDQGVSPGSFPI